jgi:hypothetical protein
MAIKALGICALRGEEGSEAEKILLRLADSEDQSGALNYLFKFDRLVELSSREQNSCCGVRLNGLNNSPSNTQRGETAE